MFAALVPPGQPADEKAHFRIVEYYAQHASMPVLGEPGVTYEAQTGPVYYSAAGLAERGADLVFDEEGSFYAVRVLGVLLLCPLVLLTFAISRELVPGRQKLALLSAAFVGLHPSILAIAGSVQNDLLVIDLSLFALLLLMRALRGPLPPLSSAVAIGLVTALAILTKTSALFLIPTVVIAALLRAPRQRATWLAAFVVSVLAGAGWFFVRNLHLYGDLTGHNGLRRAGLSFPPGDLTGINAVVDWFRVVGSHFAIPYEYYRHVDYGYAFEPPTVLRAVVVLAGVVVAIGLMRILRRRVPAISKFRAARPALQVAVTATATLALGYTVVYWSLQSLAPRMLFPLFPLFALLVVAGFREIARWLAPHLGPIVYAALFLAALVALDIYVLAEVAGIGRQPYWLFA